MMLGNSNLQQHFYSIPEKYQAYIIRTIGIDLFSMEAKDILQLDYHLFYNVISLCSWLETNDIELWKVTAISNLANRFEILSMEI